MDEITKIDWNEILRNFKMDFIDESKYLPRRFWNKLQSIRLYIRTFYERGRYGIGTCDSWGLCSYLSDIINRGVRRIRESNIGHPVHVVLKELSVYSDEEILEFIMKFRL